MTQPSKQHTGQWVRYYAKGWRFAQLIEVGRKWCRLKRPDGKRVKAKVEDVELWEEVCKRT